MILKGNKVTLRPIEIEDASLLQELINDPEIGKYVIGWSFPVSKTKQLQWIQKIQESNNICRYIIETEDCGAIGLGVLGEIDWKNRSSNIGIKIKSDNAVRGKGIGSECIYLMIQYAFEELNLNSLHCKILDYNIASQKLFTKCGFIHTGKLREYTFRNQKYHDVLTFSLLQNEYYENETIKKHRNYPDIYFTPEYGKVYEKWEQGTLEQFEFRSNKGAVYNQFIKREIPIKVDGRIYYDIVTPYGYGGPIVLDCIEAKKEDLIKEYYSAFEKYCKENSIVSEFIRFHPIVKNYHDFKSVYEVEYIRNTLGTNIKDFDDPVQSEFSKSCRKKIRQGINKGLYTEIDFECNTIDEFINIYYSTMDRNEAGQYYYFDRSYFYSMIEKFKEHLMIFNVKLEEKTVASGFYMRYKGLLHAHLSGTLPEYLNISPANMIRYAAVTWGKENGIEYLHHGGGTSNSTEDGLYKFKKGFSENTEFEFHVAKKVWNEEIYANLVNIAKASNSVNFFPQYRCK